MSAHPPILPSISKEAARERIARRIAAEFRDRAASSARPLVINLGVGMPTLVANYLTGANVVLQTENGMIGVGPLAPKDRADRQLINAGRQPVTETPGCAYFDSATSFGMIRGGHIDATVIGAFEVDETGGIANWIIPGGKMLGVGGAMDLASGVRQVVIAMRHVDADGAPKLVRECSLPLTARHEADLVVTDLGVFRFVERRLYIEEIAPEVSLEEVKALTGASFTLVPGLRAMAA